VQGGELNSNVKRTRLKQTEGFISIKVTPNSGAQKAGLKKRDVI
jgi:S1-C subfamily serine protease